MRLELCVPGGWEQRGAAGAGESSLGGVPSAPRQPHCPATPLGRRDLQTLPAPPNAHRPFCPPTLPTAGEGPLRRAQMCLRHPSSKMGARGHVLVAVNTASDQTLIRVSPVQLFPGLLREGFSWSGHLCSQACFQLLHRPDRSAEDTSHGNREPTGPRTGRSHIWSQPPPSHGVP